MNHSTDLYLAREAARAAGRVVMEHFRTQARVRFKSPDQPVTAADLAADRLLTEWLLGARPEYGWLSEETADSPERLRRRRVWIVDPIDGTNSFVEGRAEFVISVGLVEDQEVSLAVAYNPATDELYHAVRGGGAFCNDRPIGVAQAPAPGEGVMLASRTELRRGELEPFAAHWKLMPLGSTAYRMLKVADGTGHAFVSGGPKHEWDVCAAALVVEEAGGWVRQADGAPLRFNQPAPVFRGIAATYGVRLLASGRAHSTHEHTPTERKGGK